MQQAEHNEETIETVESTDKSLNANDRCDACGAQAYIRVGLSTGELLFCSHHGNANKAKLEPISKFWHDESDKLLVR